MKIIIKNDQNKIFINNNLIKKMKKISKITLKHICSFKNYEISILITNNENIKIINNKYRKINKETDVLSFSFFENNKENKEPFFVSSYENIIIGEIIISSEKAKKQSLILNHSFSKEILYLLIHGILHIFEYNHNNKTNKSKMRELENKILKKFNS